MKYVLSLFFLLLVAYTSGQRRRDGCFGELAPRVENTGIRTLARNYDTFAIEFLKDITTREKNNQHSLVISPYSVWSVLLLAYLGAASNTRRQLRAGIRVLDPYDAFYNFGDLSKSLSNLGGVDFKQMNAAYFSNDVSLRDCVITNGKKIGLERIDFKNTAKATKDINDKVAAATNQQINPFLFKGDLQGDNVFMLVNAIYFKGNWSYPFDGPTRSRPFTDHKRRRKNVDMMQRLRNTPLNYINSTRLRAEIVELPYEDSSVSMIIILPDRRTDLDSVLKSLSSRVLDSELSKASETLLRFSMPKVGLGTRIAKEVRETLFDAMGIREMFSSSAANFTNFEKFKTNRDLYVEAILHVAKIDINEEGTVASAGTGSIGTRKGFDVINVVVDRPYAFLIRENRSGMTVFAGVLRDPDHLEKKKPGQRS